MGSDAEEPTAESAADRQRGLRFAIAIRGGVSLAVWMGGAVREVVRLREGSIAEHGTYARMLRLAGYTQPTGDGGSELTPVTIDVLAGTSAGGLNASLLASHLVYGIPFDDRIRNIWLTVGDLEGLTRSPAEPVPPSLLRGDTAFYATMKDELEAMPRTPPRGRRSLHTLRLILTATRLEPRQDALRPDVGDALAFEDSRAHFRFRYRNDADAEAADGALSDFGLDDDGIVESLERLAYAARSTSSFPGAFEAASVVVGGDGVLSVGGDEPGTDHQQLPQFAGISSETALGSHSEPTTVALIDGGLLDNVPIDWALRAIAGARAPWPPDRWLLYLEPVPQKRPAISDRSASRKPATRLLRMAFAARRTRGQSSSMLSNAQQVRAADADEHRLAALADTGALAAGSAATVEAAGTSPRIQNYLARIRASEALRWQQLLEDPISVIGPDPLAIPPLQHPLTHLDRTGYSTEFLDNIGSAAGVLTFPDAGSLDELRARSRSPMPLARTVTLIGDWMRSMDQRRDVVGPDVRAQVYEARFAAEVLLAVSDRMILRTVSEAVAQAADSTDPGASLRALDANALVISSLNRTAALLSDMEMPDNFSSKWDTWASHLASHTATVVHERPTSRDNGYERFWELLADLAATVGAAARRAPIEDDVPNPFRSLNDAAAGRSPRAGLLNVLSAAEVLIGPLRSDPLAEPTPFKFAAVSAAAGSLIEEDVFGPAKIATFASPEARVSSKLSGNQVHNFAAFLSARWRLNDWIWGRLDAARFLAQILVESMPDKRVVTASEAREQIYLAGELHPDWKQFLTERWNSRFASQTTGGSSSSETASGSNRIARSTLVQLLTDRLQWEILAEEIPVLEELADSDAPPDAALLERAAKKVVLVEPAPGPAAVTAVTADDVAVAGRDPLPPATPVDDIVRGLERLGRTGEETPRQLLRKRDLRRSILRLGLVGWRALSPAGNRAGRVARGALRVIEPVVWLPFLLALTAPLATIFAGICMMAAVAVSVDRVASLPADLIVLTGSLVALGSWRWQSGTSDKVGLGRAVLWMVVALAMIGGLITVWCFDWRPFDMSDWERAAIVAGLAALGTIIPSYRILRFSGRAAIFVIFGMAAVAALLACLLAYAIVSIPEGNRTQSWLVLLVLYVPLAVACLVLHRFYPMPARKKRDPSR